MAKFVDKQGDVYTAEAVIHDAIYMRTYWVSGELEQLKAKQRVVEELLGILLENSSTTAKLTFAKEYQYTLE